MSVGFKNQQSCPDKLELQDTCISSWLPSLLRPQTFLFFSWYFRGSSPSKTSSTLLIALLPESAAQFNDSS